MTSPCPTSQPQTRVGGCTVMLAFIAIIADRLIAAWSKRRKAELGLE